MPVLLLTGNALNAVTTGASIDTILHDRGKQVIRPKDVADGVMLATGGKCSIVLIDPELDNQHGNSVTEIIRSAELGDTHTPIIGLGVLRPGAKEYCAAVGMDDCIDLSSDEKLEELAMWLDVSQPPCNV